MRSVFKPWLLATILAVSLPAGADGLEFERLDQGAYFQYRYALENPLFKGAHDRVEWILPKSLVSRSLQQELLFSQIQQAQSLFIPLLQGQLQQWILEYNQQRGTKALEISFIDQSTSYKLKYQTEADRHRFDAIHQQLKKKLMRQAYLGRDSRGLLMVDYARIVDEYQLFVVQMTRQLLRNQAFLAQLGYRQQVEWLANFVQQIEYDSHPMRFRHPATVIHENRGDCDEKSVLLSLLIKALPGSGDVLLMHVEESDRGADHMIIFVEMPATPADERIEIKGRVYIPIETTHTLKIGKAPSIVSQRIKEGRYQLLAL